MATSLETYAPYDSGAGANTTEATWRKFMKNNQGGSGVLRGILNDFTVFADSTGLQVKVQSGECWIQGHWGTNTSTVTLAIATAPTTAGHTRKDRVILRNDFVNNRIELDVLTGVSSTGTPATPSLTQDTTKWETGLAVVTVGNSVSTIAAGDVSLAHAVDFTSSFTKYRRAVGSTQAIPTTTLEKIQFPTAIDNLSAAVTPSGTNNNTWTFNRGGEWTITATAAFENTGSVFSGTRWLIIADPTTGTLTRYTCAADTALSNTLTHLGGVFNCSITERFAAGASICAWAYQDSGATLNLTSNETTLPTTISLRWNGW